MGQCIVVGSSIHAPRREGYSTIMNKRTFIIIMALTFVSKVLNVHMPSRHAINLLHLETGELFQLLLIFDISARL